MPQLVYEHISFTVCLRMTNFKAFDLLKVVVGHCDLISWFSDFAFYLDTQLIYEHISFTVCLFMTRLLTRN